MIRKLAIEMGVERLSRRTFLSHSGLTSWAIDTHFDNWSDACKAAGIDRELKVSERPKVCTYTKEECLAELRRVATLLNTTAVSSTQYGRYGRISKRTISRRFHGWDKALATVGLTSSAYAERTRPLTREECIQHLQRVARTLGRQYLTSREFSRNSKISAVRIVRAFKESKEPWHTALREAGLQPSPNFKQEVPLAKLSDDFLHATIELGRVPSLIQLTRRSSHVSHTFGSGKPGGYKEFKRRAIYFLFSNQIRIPSGIKELLNAERAELGDNFIALDLPWTEEKLRAILPFEFEHWAVVALGGIKNKTQVGDKGIDGRIFPVTALNSAPVVKASELQSEERFYPLQVKQKDKVGRPDIDAFETAMRRAKCEKGFFVSFDYTSDALREIDRFFREEHQIIIPLTVREILGEEIARKLA